MSENDKEELKTSDLVLNFAEHVLEQFKSIDIPPQPPVSILLPTIEIHRIYCIDGKNSTR